MDEEFEIKLLEPPIPIAPVPHLLPFLDPVVRDLVQIGTFRQGQPLVFISRPTISAMEVHTQEFANQGEVGGILIGSFCVHGETPFITVEAALPAHTALSHYGGLEFTPDALLEVDAERERTFPSMRLVGWYHSHPGFGVFMSGTDLASHRRVFKDGPFLAMVLDPHSHTHGLFGWVNDGIAGPLAYWIAETL